MPPYYCSLFDSNNFDEPADGKVIYARCGDAAIPNDFLRADSDLGSGSSSALHLVEQSGEDGGTQCATSFPTNSALALNAPSSGHPTDSITDGNDEFILSEMKEDEEDAPCDQPTERYYPPTQQFNNRHISDKRQTRIGTSFEFRIWNANHVTRIRMTTTLKRCSNSI